MTIKELLDHHKAEALKARALLNAASYGTGSGSQEARDKYYFHVDAIAYLSTIEDAEEE